MAAEQDKTTTTTTTTTTAAAQERDAYAVRELSMAGHDLLSLTYNFLDELLFVFSTELYVVCAIQVVALDLQGGWGGVGWGRTHSCLVSLSLVHSLWVGWRPGRVVDSRPNLGLHVRRAQAQQGHGSQGHHVQRNASRAAREWQGRGLCDRRHLSYFLGVGRRRRRHRHRHRLRLRLVKKSVMESVRAFGGKKGARSAAARQRHAPTFVLCASTRQQQQQQQQPPPPPPPPPPSPSACLPAFLRLLSVDDDDDDIIMTVSFHILHSPPLSFTILHCISVPYLLVKCLRVQRSRQLPKVLVEYRPGAHLALAPLAQVCEDAQHDRAQDVQRSPACPRGVKVASHPQREERGVLGGGLPVAQLEAGGQGRRRGGKKEKRERERVKNKIKGDGQGRPTRP